MSEPASTQALPAQSAPAVKAYRREIGGTSYRWRLRLASATTLLFLGSVALLAHSKHNPVLIGLVICTVVAHFAADVYLCLFWRRRPLRRPGNLPEHLKPLAETLELPDGRWYFLDHRGDDIWMFSSLDGEGAWLRLHCHFIWVRGKGAVNAKDELAALRQEA